MIYDRVREGEELVWGPGFQVSGARAGFGVQQPGFGKRETDVENVFAAPQSQKTFFPFGQDVDRNRKRKPARPSPLPRICQAGRRALKLAYHTTDKKLAA